MLRLGATSSSVIDPYKLFLKIPVKCFNTAGENDLVTILRGERDGVSRSTPLSSAATLMHEGESDEEPVRDI